MAPLQMTTSTSQRTPFSTPHVEMRHEQRSQDNLTYGGCCVGMLGYMYDDQKTHKIIDQYMVFVKILVASHSFYICNYTVIFSDFFNGVNYFLMRLLYDVF